MLDILLIDVSQNVRQLSQIADIFVDGWLRICRIIFTLLTVMLQRCKLYARQVVEQRVWHKNVDPQLQSMTSAVNHAAFLRALYGHIALYKPFNEAYISVYSFL